MKIRFLSLIAAASFAFIAIPAFAEGDACESADDTYNTCSSDIPTYTYCDDYYGSSYCWEEPDYQWIQDCMDLFQQLYEECQRIQQEQNQPPIMPTPDPYPNGDGPTPIYPEDFECPPEDTMPLPVEGPQIACNGSSSGYLSSSSSYSSSSSDYYNSCYNNGSC